MDRKRQLKNLQKPPEQEKPDIEHEIWGKPYAPMEANKDDHRVRDENPVVYMDISLRGGKRGPRGQLSKPRLIGRLHIELRMDMVPMACSNFQELLLESRGVSIFDGVKYAYVGTKLHRIVKNRFFQAGDLLAQGGECSRSIFDKGGLFCDENFTLRHAGPGCLSMCNRGCDTNGSLFQITFTRQETLDEKCVVFGCCCSEESMKTLEEINTFGSQMGEPTEELYISAAGRLYPDELHAAADTGYHEESSKDETPR
jgi:cyclophilin family peptidyl-prolyl cis-trans isomerase